MSRHETDAMKKKPGGRPGFFFVRTSAWAMALAIASPVLAAERIAKTEGTRLAAFFESEYQYRLKESPESATFDGVHTYDALLHDASPAAVARRRAHVDGAIRALEGFDPRRLSPQDRISRDLMLEQYKARVEVNRLYGDLPFDGLDDWVVVSPTWGPHQGFATLVSATSFASPADYENYLKRLAALPRVLDQYIDKMRVGMRSGWMPPKAIMEHVPEQFDAFASEDVKASPLYRPFENFGAGIAAADRERLASAGRKVLGDAVAPAFGRMRRFVADEYIAAGRPSVAASELPGGIAYYAMGVKSRTTTTLAPKQVHETGLSEVERIGGGMDRLIASLGFEGTRTAFFDKIRADPQFYYTRPDDMLKDYRDIAKRVDAELPQLFAELPRLPYGIRAMEAYEGDNAEHYTSGAIDGSRAGFFEANVLSLATRPRYDMENTFLHEAVPGHHLQIARAQELKGLPRFRRNGNYTAYVEGWALYAESLGPALGVYRDPYSRFGALGWEMVRACRLVIDTGLHAFGWTREQSIRYMMDNAGLQRGYATAEIDRYIASPAQALGYKIGELKIKALRDRAKTTLGERFDIRFFHNAILDHGALPLTVLEARIDEWIATRAKAAR